MTGPRGRAEMQRGAEAGEAGGEADRDLGGGCVQYRSGMQDGPEVVPLEAGRPGRSSGVAGEHVT